MQTFLPYHNFKSSAKCLDYKRLGKQRVEASQIINIIQNNKTAGGWVNHPAVKMWRHNLDALKYYYECIVDEWITRGYNNNMPTKTDRQAKFEYPGWFGSEEFHASHRSNLLRKNEQWYKQFGWKESNDLEYVWPK